MIRLAWTLTRATGWGRMALIGACTAVASGLLLVAFALFALPEFPGEALFDLVADPGVRYGAAFGVILLTMPLWLLLYQGVRLGTAARERRFAALRVAGATPGEVRRLGAIEVGLPTALGAVAGIAVYGLLRAGFGGVSAPSGLDFVAARPYQLVPTTVTPSWWQFVLVVAGITAIGLAVGWRVSARVLRTPVEVARDQRDRPPRLWGLLPLFLAPLTFMAGLLDETGAAGTPAAIAAMGLTTIAFVSLGPWVAHRLGRAALVRTNSPATLLAASRLISDPKPAGRAAAAIGAIALVAGGAGVVAAKVITDIRPATDPSFFVASLRLLAVVLLAALLSATASVAVHSVESLLYRRRSIAALAAAGTPLSVLERAAHKEASLVVLPVALAGASLGTLAVAGFALWTDGSLAGIPYTAANLVAIPLLVWVAIGVASRIVRPWLPRAAAPGSLRTE